MCNHKRKEELAITEEKQQTPFAEMATQWQKTVWEGFEMMLKAPAFAAGVGKTFELEASGQQGPPAA